VLSLPPSPPPPPPQFLLHLLGYLLLEVSQTVLIWLISTRELWNGAERASQEYVGLTLAIIMVRVRVRVCVCVYLFVRARMSMCVCI
jgi:hypothetical protein